MKKKLDYARFTHLAGMFMIAMFIYLFSTIPHKFWVLLTVLVVSAGIEPGLIVRRAIHRIGGTFSALMILIPLIYLMQLNYRMIAVIFIIALIGLSVSSLNPRRYDISVFFTTIMIFLLLAQTTELNSLESPADMIINRFICTLIGIAIILIGDYLLFNAYAYSQKLYLFHQRMIYLFFKNTLQLIDKSRPEDINTFLFVERLRGEMISHCAPIAISAENLKLEKKLPVETKERLERFQNMIWDMRRLVFALCVSKFVLHQPETTEKHRQQLKDMIQEASTCFIRL